ncbi:MAG: T9SS type A sorting domain-containing protein [Bacteroidales bacterium]|nr:T9SS type A sorting domain-containing protein [Bacteroidales bacterium]
MRKFYSIILLFVLSGTAVFAQNAVPASGGNANGSSGSVSYTVGQPFYSANVGTSGQVSEGVQQAYEIYDVTEVQNPISANISLSAFPNPTSDYLTLLIDGDFINDLDYAMYDITGKEIMQMQISSSETSIDMQSLPPATYFVRVTKGKNEVKTFKVVKK